MGITQCAYAELAVDDLDRSLGFHTDVIEMVELGRENGTVSLGCGADQRCDLVLRNGGTGVRLVALEVESEEDLERYAGRLSDRGVDSARRSDPRAGVADALCFASPSGLAVELVLTKEGPAYLNPGQSDHRGGIAPIDFDHITLKVPDPVAMVAFLTGALGFSVSDEMRPAPDVLVAAWTRAGSQHHDIAMFKGPELNTWGLRLDAR
ncbi:MAG: VOC family protein [Solirubrobacteraceae bacterium]